MRRLRLPHCIAIILAVVMVGVVGTAQWRTWNPRVDTVPDDVDAVMVLAYGPSRMQAGRELVQDLPTENLVLSISQRMQSLFDSGELGREMVNEDPWVEQCDEEYEGYRTFCFRPVPHNTIGEARAFSALAAEEGWDSVAIVTERSHLDRATRIFTRCFSGTVYAVDSRGDSPWWRNIGRGIYEALAEAKELISGGAC